VSKKGEVVLFHRAHITPGVRKGIVLASGAHGARVKDIQDGTNHEVLHEGIYRHITATIENLADVIAELRSMGIQVHLTEEQKKYLRD